MRFVRVAWCLVAVLLLARVGVAQQTTGTILGRVADGTGAILPGVTVSASNPSTGFNRVAVSDA